ncbi:hypothetical protein RUM44_011567 [Polyplax serrata]|uniref:Uncharacterized protein n=1 Tax=Polyplax serrata TaxID=468196 RepID=A0ABR1AQF0_POLSC
MGNSHSQQHQFVSHQWTQSYPRTKHIQPQVKVLPERLPPLRLRTTDNGAILQNGGTLSSRKQSLIHEERAYRPRSSSAHRPPKLGEIGLDKNRYGSEPDLRYHHKESREQFSENAVRQRISRSRKKYKAPPAPQNGISSGMESSSSDLNGWESSKDCPSGQGRKARLFKTRAETNKKNFANSRKLESGIRESELTRSTEVLTSLGPKYRDERLHSSTNVEKERSERLEKKGLKRSASHEVISTRKSLATPEFQAELREAAQRLRPLAGIHRQSPVDTKPINPKGHSKNQVKNDMEITSENECMSRKKNYQSYNGDEVVGNNRRSENVGSRGKLDKPENLQMEEKKIKPDRDVPSKKFYFGMEDNNNNNNNNDINTVNNYASTNNVDKTNAEHRITAVAKSKNLMNLYKSVADGGHDWEDTVDKFAASFHKSNMVANGNTTSCSSSFVSDPDEDVDGGIALKLRPTLPKKQLEIPRFSPTAAWRLLSSIDMASPQAPSQSGSDDIPVLLEDRIHPPISQQVLRNSNDKSGDSGISGDASPGGCPESSSEIAITSGKVMTSQNSKSLLMAWTPQQDLEEESSSDDLDCPVNSSKNVVSNIPGAKFSPRSQLFLSRDHSFSMSLPRDEKRMSAYRENEDLKERNNMDSSYKLNSLQKLKVALGTSKRNEEDQNHYQSDNWVLSRSVPSSLNNHVALARTMSNPSSPEQEDDYSQQTSLKYPSYSYLGHGGRMMYLPEYHSRMSPEAGGAKHRISLSGGFLSKSCENIMQAEMKQLARSRTPSPIVSQSNDDAWSKKGGSRSNQKKKKFTFQSTVRLLENRKLAERLSREAELKENQRLTEVEAMKKVEEEFQKKRAREKASIRHQLRLFSLEEKNYSSLPPVEWEENRYNSEAAPTSLPVPSSQTPVPMQDSRKISTGNRKTSTSSDKFASSTQVLSEYREQIRDYRDYRHPRYTEIQVSLPDNNKRSIVEHPRVVYDMPKSTAVYVSAPVNSSAQNYYKDDGRCGGVPTGRSSSSDNYRKDFAHGALASGGRSLNSSDSELSQSNGRPARITSRKLNALHRSRSVSPESVSRSVSPPRSRSNSPFKTMGEKSRSLTPDGMASGGRVTPEFRNFDRINITSNYRSLSGLERKLSNTTGDYHSTFNSHKRLTLDRSVEKMGPVGNATGDILLRLGVPSLQPFNKSEKSYRPINFNPVVNKLAQTVN